MATVQTIAQEIADLSLQHDGDNSQSIVTKAQQLIETVQSPMDHASTKLFNMIEPAAIGTLMQFGVFKAIPDPPESITIQDLETKTGAQAALLSRLLRIVVSSGLIRYEQRSDGIWSYSHTSTSKAYGEGFIGTLFLALYTELITTAMLPEYFETHEPREPDGDDAETKNPTTWRAGREGEKTAFDIIEADPVRLKNFHVLSGMAEHFRPYTGFFDYGKLAQDAGERPVFVDIGGGNGAMIKKVLEAHPNVKPEQCVLQDREAVIQLAQEQQREGNLPESVKCQVHDFFEDQPIKHAKAYHLRAITHDWSDTTVVKVLSKVVSAMGTDSKLLIADNVVAEHGVVKGLAPMMDLMMLCIGGKERTRKDFEDVLDAAGLRIREVYYANAERDVGGFAVVEAVLK
jgi:hypothetical protein